MQEIFFKNQVGHYINPNLKQSQYNFECKLVDCSIDTKTSGREKFDDLR